MVVAKGGSYVVWDATEPTEFPVPQTSWTDQALGDGLDNMPRLNAYRLHTWRWPSLPGEDMAHLIALFYRQLSGGLPPSAVETDPYYVDPDDLCDEEYATVVYEDITIKSVTPIERGLPVYNNPTITFEVLVT